MIWTTLSPQLPIVGQLRIIGNETNILACTFAGFPPPKSVQKLLPDAECRCTAQAREVTDQLRQYLSGSKRELDVELDLQLLSAFQKEVLVTLRDQVNYGQTTTYGELAASIGRPTAVRAVARALATNPCCLLLPCHRVIGAAGTLTGYAGGLPRKQQLLALEAAS